MSLLRLVAEHEAAHVVVAAALGVTVRRAVINTLGQGRTLHDGTDSTADAAAITAAGDVWNQRLGVVPYQDLACLDLQTFEREHGLGKLWQANRTAHRILSEERSLVLALAERLVGERDITFDGTPAAA
ncbi:hypothetical protein [Streptomyces europaeiscabiei]|uniref:hypothetical protein n=1 Tax=Streptomyces europaeiscabiei TaxID=146819 RepID=UPI0029B32902|nr:hypothetical protein [Streptomyces europaeiscabiei]MDX3581996.1 hypothetical protein [Streptomyces europaeiscabiei]